MIEFHTAAGKLEFSRVLNRLGDLASSDLGRSAAAQIAPVSDFGLLSDEYDRVDELKRLLESDASLPVDGIRNVRDALARSSVENALLTPSDLFSIASTLAASRSLHTFLGKRRETYPALFRFCESLFIDAVLEYNIIQAIDENGLVKDSASKELRSVRREIVVKYDLLRRHLERILRGVSDQGFVQEEIITTRDGRMVIPVKIEQKQKVPGFIHSTSASGSTVFIEPAETLTVNNEIRELLFREQREIDRILRALTAEVKLAAAPMTDSLRVLAQLDLTFAKARYSIEIKGNRPRTKDVGSLVIIEGRHPILLMRHPREMVQALTLTLGEKYQTLLITGPNAGGKSVALKTTGILVLMNQCGIHVPASSDSEFPMFQRFFVDIGDDQSIENDLSTFSSHVLSLKGILQSADDRSLVLLDEIGAGTDPTEGGALAAAVLKDLTDRSAFTIATSHQVSLKAFVHENPGMENGAMEFDQASLLPTYRFRAGVPGSSYAFEIARRLGLPEDILATALRFVGEQKSRLESLVLSLESRTQEAEERLNRIEVERSKSSQLAASYEAKLKTLNEEVRAIKTKALDEARGIVEHANAIVERSVREIRQRQADRAVIKESKEAIQHLERELSDVANVLESIEAPNGPNPGKAPEPGDLIRLNSGSQVGEVLAGPDESGNMLVAFNSIRMRVPLHDATFVSKPHGRVSLTVQPIAKDARREVDVRGMYGDEAVTAVDKFLDDAVLTGLRRVDIIHGKGSGALRKRIAQFLETDSRVGSHRPGEWNEGGMGVTVVELKE